MDEDPFDSDRPLSARQATGWMPVIGIVSMVLGLMIVTESAVFGNAEEGRLGRSIARLLILVTGGRFVYRWWALRAKERLDNSVRPSADAKRILP